MPAEAPSIYEPRNILITGAAGFIGGHVANLLFNKYPQYKIVVLDIMDICANIKNLAAMLGKPNFKFVRGSFGSIDLVNFILKEEEIDTIMHFGAQTHVDLSFGNSSSFTETNILNTHKLIEAVRLHKHQIRRFIHVSTDEVYGENANYSSADDLKSEELSALEPTNPYAASKAGAEMLVKSYFHSYEVPTIVTRGNNVYGPRQYPEKLIPKMAMMLHFNRKLTIHGNGSSKRSYLHVDDVAHAFDLILHKGAIGSTYNIGTDKEYTVLEVVKKICTLLKPYVPLEALITHVRDRPFNDSRYYLDMTKLKSLGWESKVTFDEGITSTVSWYMQNAVEFWSHTDLQQILVAHPSQLVNAQLEDTIRAAAVEPPAKRAKTSIKFLIFGRTGWIGGLLGKLLEKMGHDFQYATSRLEDSTGVEREILYSRCSHVLNAAGLTGRPNVDWCETHRKEVIRVNVVGTLRLADLCETHGVHMTNFATGCIFHYDEKHPEVVPRDKNLVSIDLSTTFTEEDRANFAGSYYSQTKGYVENMLREYENVLTLRVRMPIDSDPINNKRNFLYKIAHYEKVVNIPNSMTVLDELLPYAIEMAIRKRTGIYNFCNPGAISHNQCLELYRDYLKPDLTWKNFTIEEQAKVITAGRSNNELSPKKLWEEFPNMLPIIDSLKKFVFEPAQKAVEK